MSKLKEKLQKLNGAIGDSIYQDRRRMVGRVLTVTDASITDPEQRKAVKDLVENAIYGENSLNPGGSLGLEIHNAIARLAASEGFELYNAEAVNEVVEPTNEYDI
jgi:hypothetical protein